MKVLGDNNTLKQLLAVTILVSIAFALFIIPLSVKNLNGEYCSTTQSKQLSKNYINSSVLLDSNNAYLLTSIEGYSQETYVLQEDYCFKAYNNGSVPLNINIIDSDLKVLANNYFSTGVNTLCTTISSTNNVLGVECVTCNSTNALMFYDDPTSPDENINLNGLLSVNNPLSINLVSYLSCKELIKDVFKYYIYFLSLMGFIMLIIIGVDGFGGFLLEW